jgi:FixJ family two-component response regulator
MIKTDLTIFVIDDDESVIRALRNLLESAGFRVKTFRSAQDFLDSGRSESHNVLILDVRMPELSGIELQKQLAASGSKLPVIFITAHEDTLAEKTALEAGAVAFLQKPFDDQLLFDAIDIALNRIAH